MIFINFLILWGHTAAIAECRWLKNITHTDIHTVPEFIEWIWCEVEQCEAVKRYKDAFLVSLNICSEDDFLRA